MDQKIEHANNLNGDKFVGREQEIEKIKDMIWRYNFHESFVFNLCGQGGIGKTRLTRKISEKAEKFYENTPMRMREKAKLLSIYVNVSGCKSVPTFLFRFRQELKKQNYDFEKFDIMYQLYYDAAAFSKEQEFQSAEDKKDRIEYGEHGEVRFKEKYLDTVDSLGHLLIDFFNDYMESTGKQQCVGIGLHAALSLSGLDLIRILYREEKNNEKIQGYVELLKEIDRKSGVLEREETLVQYFLEALDVTDNVAKFFFIDNFQQGNQFENLGAVLGILKKIKAFWMISSRDLLPYGHYRTYIELQGLDEKAAVEKIKQSALTLFESEEQLRSCITNFDVISQNIITAVRLSKENPDLGVHPLFLTPMCIQLIEEIKEKQDNQDEQSIGNVYNIDSKQFTRRNKKLGEAYYFELGLTGADLDCIHVISCKDVWDKYILTEIRNRLGLYLLNTKYILASNSMMEVVGRDQIKLHEKIKEILFESPNNRIKYDVFEIMHDTFLEIQEKNPILNSALLESFFEFSQQFCTYLLEGNYSYRGTSAYQEFTNFYRAFKVSVDKQAYKAGGDTLKSLYKKITEFYIVLAKNSFYNEDKWLKAYESFYDRGLYLSNVGDSAGAIDADTIYLKHIKILKDPFRYAKALNSVGFDFSSNHDYENAYQFGTQSLEVAFEGMKKYVEKNSEDVAAKKITDYYERYFLIGEQPIFFAEEELEEIVSEITPVLQEVKQVKKNSASAVFQQILEQLLKTRGNIPWYFIHNPQKRQKWSLYAVQFGEITYRLRKAYYGENSQNALVSYHNMGAYKMKLHENERKGVLVVENREYDREFQKCCDIFGRAYSLRVKYLKNRSISKKEISQYYQELETDSQDKFGGQKFTDIYSVKMIERIYPREEDELDFVDEIDFLSENVRKTITSQKDLRQCNLDALESLQYLSNAKYNVAVSMKEEEEKKKCLDEAIEIADITAVTRSFAMGLRHRKTLESIRYAAEYCYEAGKEDEALKRINYVVENTPSSETQEVPKKVINEYKKLLEKIKGK